MGKMEKWEIQLNQNKGKNNEKINNKKLYI